ncbi:IclR family transcriptional regulator [Anaerotignum sp.]|uniref:IclR family transcriptional regulator n=1 Tax=Anaerotignum sp. TaxID=2039241 RepID=UPI00331810A7
MKEHENGQNTTFDDSLNKHSPKYPVLTLEKAIEIIDFLKKNAGESGVSLVEICQGLEMKKSSVHRILDTLYSYDYVEKNSSGSKYKLSWELYNIGNTVPKQHSLSSEQCVPILNCLCEKHIESFSIGIRDGAFVTVAFNVEPNISLKASSHIGEKLPIYATSKGKLILSQLSDSKIYDFFRENKIEAFTGSTITTPGKMLNELFDIRENGFALDKEEHCEGLSCIAVPIRNFEGKIIASLSASGPTQRILPKIENGIKQDLLEASKSISSKLGYKEK